MNTMDTKKMAQNASIEADKEIAVSAAEVSAKAAGDALGTKTEQIKSQLKTHADNARRLVNDTAETAREKFRQVRDCATNPENKERCKQKFAEEKAKVKAALRDVTKEGLDYSAKAAEFIAEKAHNMSDKL